MEDPRLAAGQRLRILREQKGLTIREVEEASHRLAKKYENEEFFVPVARLSDIERKGILPSIFKLYSLAAIYQVSFNELIAHYGVDPDNVGFENDVISRPKTHLLPSKLTLRTVEVPVKMDPAFKITKTSNLGRLIEKWGAFPFTFLEQLADSDFTYGYIGLEDFTMYPVIVPGSFIQVDERKNKIVEKSWRSEYERPVYFIETRDGHVCSWCSLKDDQLVIQPHPLSPVAPRILKYTREAEIIGQVVGIAMRLGEWRPLSGKDTPTPRELN